MEGRRSLCAPLKARFPTTAVLMLTAYAYEAHVRDAIAAGADGYLLKDAGRADLIERGA